MNTKAIYSFSIRSLSLILQVLVWIGFFTLFVIFFCFYFIWLVFITPLFEKQRSKKEEFDGRAEYEKLIKG